MMNFLCSYIVSEYTNQGSQSFVTLVFLYHMNTQIKIIFHLNSVWCFILSVIQESQTFHDYFHDKFFIIPNIAVFLIMLLLGGLLSIILCNAMVSLSTCSRWPFEQFSTSWGCTFIYSKRLILATQTSISRFVSRMSVFDGNWKYVEWI